MRHSIVVLALVLFPVAGQAQTGLLSGFFVGGAWQSNSIRGGSGAGTTRNPYTDDLKSGSGTLVVGGWQLGSLLGVVGRISTTNFDGSAATADKTTIRQSEVLARVVLPFSFSRLTPFVEAGLALRDFDAKRAGVATITASGNTPIYGVGLRLRVVRGVQAEAAYHSISSDFREWKINSGATVTDDPIKAGTSRITVGVVMHPLALLAR